MGNFFSKTPAKAAETSETPAKAAETPAKAAETPAKAEETKAAETSAKAVPVVDEKKASGDKKEKDETAPSTETESKDKPEAKTTSGAYDAVVASEESVDKIANTSLLAEASAAPLPQSPVSPASAKVEKTEPAETVPTKSEHIIVEHSAPAPNHESIVAVQGKPEASDQLKGPLPEQGTIECDQMQDGGELKMSSPPVQMVPKVEQLAEDLSNVVISTAAQEINTTTEPEDVAAAKELEAIKKLPDVPTDDIVVDAAKDKDSQDIDILPEPQVKVDDARGDTNEHKDGVEQKAGSTKVSSTSSDEGITDKPVDHSEAEKHDGMSAEVLVPGHHD